MIRKEDVYGIGRLGKPHGVKGELSFWFADDVFDREEADYLLLEVEGILVPFFIEEYRFRSDEVALVKFEDVDTDSRARELTGCEVFFPRARGEADNGYLSWAEIVGYRIVDAATGAPVGTICRVDDTTANILFEVETPEGGEVLIPLGGEMSKDVDKAARIITMELPEGLLDL